MTYVYYVNGQKRPPTKEEGRELLDRMLRCLGYEKKEEREKKQASA